MLDFVRATAAKRGVASPAVLAAPPAADVLAWRWLAAMLDEIDYGMLLLADASQALHVNQAARSELDAEHPLQLLGNKLRARRPQDVASLHEALESAARRGLRRLIMLGHGAQRVSVSVVPLPLHDVDAQRATLVTIAKRKVCEVLSIQAFARSHALTPAETRVLTALCDGGRPGSIAASQGVAISTVRTQICSIRLKTEAGSIRDLVEKVAVLPPLRSVLRCV